jgi:hypothetical protein
MTAVIKHLKVGSVPDDPKLAQLIRLLPKNLELQKAMTERDNNIIMYQHDDYIAPYMASPFWKDLIQNVYNQFGYLGYPGLMGALHSRAWWLDMKRDIELMAQHCPNCQLAQHPQE